MGIPLYQGHDDSTTRIEDLSTSGRRALQKLLSISHIYAIGSVLQQSVGFFLIPLYTRALGTEGYGTLEIVSSFAAISMVLFNLGLSSAIVKCYHQDCSSKTEQRAIFSTSLFLLLPPLVAGCTLIFLLAPWLSSQLLVSAEMRNLLQISALSVFLVSVSSIFLALFRAKQDAWTFAALSLCQFFSLTFLNIYFVAVREMGVRGILWATVLSHGLVILLALPKLWGEITLRFEKSLARPLLTFGLYVIPIGLAGWIMNLSDRYFLRFLWDLDEVGVYSLGYKFGTAIFVLVVWPFQLAWPSFSFSISRNHNHRQVYARVLTYLLVILVFVSLSVALLCQPIIRLVADEQFGHSYRIVPPVTLGYIFYGIVYCVAPGVHLKMKTQFLSLFVVLSAVVNILLNFLFVPEFGMMGAAWATAITYLLLAVSTFVFSNHVYPISYEYSRLAKIFISGLIFFCMGLLVQTDSVPIMMAWYLLIVFAFPFSLLFAGILEPDEKTVLTQVLSRMGLWQPHS